MGVESKSSERINDDRPNIVFLVVESTDGRTWTPGYQNDAIPLPNIRALQANGTQFRRHYSNAPVCCPSRATFWSGRHASNIPHEHNGVRVDGVWNNYEGLPDNFTDRMDQVLEREGYRVKMSGKLDYSTGSHSENVYLNAWTMNVRFPYNVNASGGWRDETICSSNATVEDSDVKERHADWKVVHETTKWIERTVANESSSTPFFAYQGMNIVHPPYVTNRYWSEKIDRSLVEVPTWIPLEEMHPCDFQSSMLKGCTPSDVNASQFYDTNRRREIRAVYYAMIAEFDAMVGAYVDSVTRAGALDRTVFIVVSDHGDMQMEHQQFYKMVPYEASASVPMVIYDGRRAHQQSGSIVDTVPTQLIDIFPTVMDYAAVSQDRRPSDLDGFSLLPLMNKDRLDARPDFVVSQFHGDNIAMSWFLVVKRVRHPLSDSSDSRFFKLVVWGTGQEVPSMLFDLEEDPDENRNLIGSPAYDAVVSELLTDLRSVVDYESVALNVAEYGRVMFNEWINRTSHWEQEIHAKGLRWDDSFDVNATASLEAVREWLHLPGAARPMSCRKSLVWPPPA